MSHLPIGTILRSSQYAYEVVEVLGKGGFGVTYKVTLHLLVEPMVEL